MQDEKNSPEPDTHAEQVGKKEAAAPTTKKTSKPPRAPSNSRGPTPGKYQNGKVCFSAWLPTPFFVRLRRYATNLGLDVPSLLLNDYSGRLDSLRLTDADLAEIELSNKSLK